MLTIILGGVAVTCAIGWVSRYVTTLAIIYYMQEKGYSIPNNEDMEDCTRAVTKNLVKDLFKLLHL